MEIETRNVRYYAAKIDKHDTLHQKERKMIDKAGGKKTCKTLCLKTKK